VTSHSRPCSINGLTRWREAQAVYGTAGFSTIRKRNQLIAWTRSVAAAQYIRGVFDRSGGLRVTSGTFWGQLESHSVPVL
jgi:hypothetical protein